MCGLAGILSGDGPPQRATLERMAQRLAHRGPDAQGVEIVGPMGLAHRRLAVIDTVAASNQPMADATGRYWIVYNGEIYNYREIRAELESLGVTPQTASDTEVALLAYRQWGPDCLQRFNGMFALAIWDNQERELFLARDRLGKKPLFYYETADGGLIFASELKALLADPRTPREVNPAAVSQFLSLNYLLTSACAVRGARKLPAAHAMLFRPGRSPKVWRYWDLAAHFHNKQKFANEAEAGEAFNALLEDAVRQRLVADVPLGAFLSGGIDSSTIVAAMARLRDPSKVETFSIGFAEKSYSELDAASETAHTLGLSHHTRVIDSAFAERLPELAWFCDEPFADSSIFPMLLLSGFSRDFVTVTLSGDGADELFAGYTTYTADQIHRWISRTPPFLLGWIGALANRLVPVTYNKVGWDYKIRQFLAGAALPFERAHYSWRTIFNDAEKAQLLHPDIRDEALQTDPFDDFQSFFDEVPDLHYLDRAMYVDIKTWLVDDILVKVDRTTMARALEARAPFLDYRLVEFAASLPVELKMKGLKRKHIMRASQRGRVPDPVLVKRKEGFNAPISHWLANTRDQFFADLQANPLGEGLFDQNAVAQLWREHMAMGRDNGLRLLGLTAFHMWREAALGRSADAPPPAFGPA
ncbi:asparagine synthase (glutamine-hydrolyzing) [Magnetofaba australis]|uniref:asparagine synthase (glutamine-hydrolyzing) n=1 Tax=Magnetofaba australis IT-1 TaxID=1434232 RepID=A0A1Y2KAM8_9PROT|nr:asparagine synthase (glutamine-hydrolyzing) [Magnetofaba australis]OSM06865.1 putative asparagine synthase [Magnetofaba australis IT-1]